MIEDHKTSDTILLIGNGPSTRDLVDYGFKNIPDTIDTFGMGAAYRFYERINWWPDFYGWLDCKTVTSHEENLSRIIEDDSIPVKGYMFSRKISDHPKLEVVKHGSTGDGILKKVLNMGYTKILLIGMDCNYQEKLEEAQRLPDELAEFFLARAGLPIRKNHVLMVMKRTPECNPNYFFSDYQQEGDIFSIPRAKRTHLPSWKMLARKYKNHRKVEIVDCSKISNLTFKRGDLAEELQKAHCLQQMEEQDNEPRED